MKKLYLSKDDKKIGGVCGGIAAYFGVDSVWVRLATVFIAFVTAIIPTILTYIAALLIIPKEPEVKIHDTQAN